MIRAERGETRKNGCAQPPPPPPADPPLPPKTHLKHCPPHLHLRWSRLKLVHHVEELAKVQVPRAVRVELLNKPLHLRVRHLHAASPHHSLQLRGGNRAAPILVAGVKLGLVEPHIILAEAQLLANCERLLGAHSGHGGGGGGEGGQKGGGLASLARKQRAKNRGKLGGAQLRAANSHRNEKKKTPGKKAKRQRRGEGREGRGATPARQKTFPLLPYP